MVSTRLGKKLGVAAAAACALGMVAGGSAQAGTVSLSGTSVTSGELLSASADFTIAGDTLTLTLTNTATADVLIQSDILTAVFFDVTGNMALTPVSAVVPGTSTVFFGGGTDPGGVVGGEWAYLSTLNPADVPNSAQQGVSSSGFGLFGGPSFPGSNLDGPVAVNGIQYGITSAGDDLATGQSAVTGSNGLIQNEVIFTFSGATGKTMSDFSNVGFQYGTALAPTDTFLGTPVPVPAAAWMGLSLLGGVGGISALRKRRLA